MVGARKQTFSQLGRDAQPHRGLQWEKVKGAEEGRSCSLAMRGSVPSGLLRGPITWMNAWGA